MNLHHPGAEIYVPDAQPIEQALKRVTHLGIGAHHDDLEFMAFHGIVQCLGHQTQHFGGVTCTDGVGSARTGPFADYNAEQMRVVRRQEQDAAALLGEYAVMVQLDYPSREIQTSGSALTEDLRQILAATQAEVIYTHNLADKHETHIAVGMAVIHAIRQLPPAQRPRTVYGCEGWRDLDWLPDEDKVLLDLSGHDAFAARINALFESQIAGGKRYDLAIMGRRRANATMLNAHEIDAAEQVCFAMNLTPLIEDDARDVSEYVLGFIEKFQADVADKLRRHARD